MNYYLKYTGHERWDDALDEFIEIEKKNPQITWHNFYMGKKNSIDSVEKVSKELQKRVDKTDGSDIFRA
jgi:hypothetical protein